jgi:hypothetical protein
VHEEITERVLVRDGFSHASRAIVIKSNVLQDEIVYEPWRHFDRVPNTTDQEAFDSGLRHIRTELDLAVGDVRKGQAHSALERIGQLFHAVQDFCSHSNFVELPDAIQQEIRLSFPNSSSLRSAGLKLTGYDPATLSMSPKGDSYPHSLHSKDGPDSRLHKEAKQAAAYLCRDLLTMIETKVADNQWRALKTCGGP